MEPKLERTLIRTFKKMRESPNMGIPEIGGLFINFYYSESNSHGGLDIRDYVIVIDPSTDIRYLRVTDRFYYNPIARQLAIDLAEITISEFYSLWIRSNFEDPKEEFYGDPIVVATMSEFHKEIKNFNIEAKLAMETSKKLAESNKEESEVEKLKKCVEYTGW